MAVILKLRAPDGMICEVLKHGDGTFSPQHWKAAGPRSPAGAADPSPGVRLQKFADARAAMMTAFRERLHRDYLRRNIAPRQFPSLDRR